MMKNFDPEDLPDTYYVLGTLHGFRFILDLAEGERIGTLLDSIELGKDGVQRPMFIRFTDYGGAVGRVQAEFLDSFYLSTPDSRAFDKAITTDSRKKGWSEDDDD